MRRLFSTFAAGAPGIGLLLMRVAAGGSLLAHAVHTLDRAAPIGATAASLLIGAVGLLVLVGLWTPITAILVALAATWIVYTQSADMAFWAFVGAVGIALALLGPGSWSIDARLFGWKRVDLRNGRGEDPPLD